MKSISLALIGLFALPSGRSVAIQLMGEDILQAHVELTRGQYNNALELAEQASRSENALFRKAGLNIKALIFLEQDNSSQAMKVILRLASINQLTFSQQHAELEYMRQELLEVRQRLAA